MLPREWTHTLLHRFGGLLATMALIGVSGCVERRMVIITDPYPAASNAIVFDEKNQPIGGTPVDKPFTYYGTYKFRIVKDGYEPLVMEQRVRAPWYELPGLDFISENLIPWTIRDVRVFRVVLQPAQVRPVEQLLQDAEGLGTYSRTIGEPLPDPNPRPVTPLTVLGPPVGEP
ncbi:MAG: hypothetical protein HY289_13315 [Planctomycetes bacterium]|nr:hypothetical protein [Planctomycetota bacterium]